MPITTDILPDGIEALKAALAAERQARQEAETRATGAEAMIAHLKLVIAKLRRERFGPSAERSTKLLDQLELQLEELEASASEEEFAAAGQDRAVVPGFTRKKPVRAPLPAHLPRERVVVPAPAACPCCGGKLAKLGEDITETLEVVPRRPDRLATSTSPNVSSALFMMPFLARNVRMHCAATMNGTKSGQR